MDDPMYPRFLKALREARHAIPSTDQDALRALDDVERAYVLAVITAQGQAYINGWFDRNQDAREPKKDTPASGHTIALPTSRPVHGKPDTIH